MSPPRRLAISSLLCDDAPTPGSVPQPRLNSGEGSSANTETELTSPAATAVDGVRMPLSPSTSVLALK
jgi:hypothetical protein